MSVKHYNDSAISPMKRVILCPPTYFNFEPINVITEDWMEKGETADLEAFKREHAELVQAYKENGVDVVMMEPTPGLPYEVYARRRRDQGPFPRALPSGRIRKVRS